MQNNATRLANYMSAREVREYSLVPNPTQELLHPRRLLYRRLGRSHHGTKESLIAND